MAERCCQVPQCRWTLVESLLQPIPRRLFQRCYPRTEAALWMLLGHVFHLLSETEYTMEMVLPSSPLAKLRAGSTCLILCLSGLGWRRARGGNHPGVIPTR